MKSIQCEYDKQLFYLKNYENFIEPWIECGFLDYLIGNAMASLKTRVSHWTNFRLHSKRSSLIGGLSALHGGIHAEEPGGPRGIKSMPGPGSIQMSGNTQKRIKAEILSAALNIYELEIVILIVIWRRRLEDKNRYSAGE